MKKKKPFKRLVCLFTALFCFAFVSFSAFAEADPGLEVINYDDYASYFLSDQEGVWNMTATFPNDWPGTVVESVWGEDRFKGNRVVYDMPYNFPPDVPPPGMRFTITPLGIEPVLYFYPDFQYTDLRLLDPSLIPKSATMEFKFDITVSSGKGSAADFLSSLGVVQFYVAFFRTSSSGGWFEFVYSDDWYAELDATLDGVWTAHITSRFSLSEYPEYSNLAFAPFIQITDFTAFSSNVVIDGQEYARVTLEYDSFNMQFPVSDAVKVALDSARGDKLLGDIEQALVDQGKQLDDFINGDIQSSAPNGSGTVDDLDQAESALIDDLSIYLDSGFSYFEGARNVLAGVGEGFHALRLISAPVFNLPFANDWVTVSVSLGLVGSLVGLVSLAQSAGHRQESKDRAASKKSRSKGG